MAARKPKPIDWESIEKEFRAGVRSIKAIAADHSISDTAIRLRAKSDKWERDLSAKVRRETRVKLVRAMTSLDSRTEREVVESAANIQVEVLRGHQKFAKQLKDIGERLSNELKAHLDAEETSVNRTSTMTDTFAKLSGAMQRVVQLERQAFNIEGARDGDDEQPTPSVDAFIEQMLRRRERIEATEQA